MADSFPKLSWDGLKIHFVAIGGIGMSAIARIAAARGAVVSGCDVADSATLAALRAQGIACTVGHAPGHVRDADVVVYSSAVPLDSPERQAALGLGSRCLSRGRMLAWLQKDSDTVAVSGSHGKTTTTWIIANMLIRCGADPTVAIGGNVAELGGNARIGAGKVFVTEADESDGSFLHLVPKYPVITNIDADHLDHWSGIEEIEKAFIEFGDRPREDSVLIACIDCPRVRGILDQLGGRRITCGVGRGDVAARNVRLLPGRAVYDAALPGGGLLRDIELSLPGVHNVRNSLAALALAVELGLPLDLVRDAFAHTSHVARRMELRGMAGGVAVYDDYAHHPAEIRATIEAAKLLPTKRLIAVFQPHRYTRTLHLQEEFGLAFDKLDLLLIAPIYAASEPPIDGVSSQLIADRVAARGKVKCETVSDLALAPGWLAARVEPGDVVMTIGAGDVWRVGDELLERIARPAASVPASESQVPSCGQQSGAIFQLETSHGELSTPSPEHAPAALET